jgi:membrane protease YdiL (CAAX protease family)
VPRGRLYALAWVFYLFLALGGAIWIGWRLGHIPLEQFVDPAAWWVDLAIGLGAGVALLGVWAGLRKLLPRARELEERLAELLGPLDPGEAVSLALISGFSEELFFRGAVQGSIPGVGGFVLALIVFTLLHTGPGRAFRLWTAFAALAGAALGGLMMWRGNLLAPVVAHVLVNAVNLRRLAGAAARTGAPAGDAAARE